MKTFLFTSALIFLVGSVPKSELHSPELQHPLNSEAQILSEFGMRYHPILETERMHTGVDFKITVGDPVHAAAAGKIIFAGYKAELFGNVIVIEHQNGLVTHYAHLQDFQESVKEGRIIEKGEEIATAGSSNQGPVLHFEVWQNNVAQDPILFLEK